MEVYVFGVNTRKWESFRLKDEPTDVLTLKRHIFQPQVQTCDSYYLCCNGRRLNDCDCIKDGQHIRAVARLPGGKGGFGSMLRAIGAQIEKTTNREACRDLSGRRLRDINEEMRLKKWIAKQTEREQERKARRKEKLELRLATPKHEFNDPKYDRQQSEIPEQVNNALEQGLAVAKLSGKRPGIEVVKNAPKKMRLWLGMDEDECDGNSSSDDVDAASCCSFSPVDKPVKKSGPVTGVATERIICQL